MNPRICLTGLVLHLLMILSALASQDPEYRFIGRYDPSYTQGVAELQRGGVFFSQPLQAGVYRIRIQVREDTRFGWYAPEVVLFADHPADPVRNGYILRWMQNGEIQFIQASNTKREIKVRAIIPGRENPNVLEPGKPLFLAIVVPHDSDVISVYCGPGEIKGDPQFRFRLETASPSGYFGLVNRGPGSIVTVDAMRYFPHPWKSAYLLSPPDQLPTRVPAPESFRGFFMETQYPSPESASAPASPICSGDKG